MKWSDFIIIQVQFLIVAGLAIYSLGRASIFESEQRTFNTNVTEAVKAIALQHVRAPGR